MVNIIGDKMTTKRFTYKRKFDIELGVGQVLLDNGKEMTYDEVVDLLNELHEENERLREHFIYLIGTALEDKECRKIYAKGLLEIFDNCSNLDEAKNKIKEYLE